MDNNNLQLFALGLITAMVAVLVFRPQTPATPDQAAEAKLRQEIMDKLNKILTDVKGTV